MRFCLSLCVAKPVLKPRDNALLKIFWPINEVVAYRKRCPMLSLDSAEISEIMHF